MPVSAIARGPDRGSDRFLTSGLGCAYFPIYSIIRYGKYRLNVIATIDDERLDEAFAALANSTRRAILSRLAKGEASVTELAEPFALTLPAISKHIKVLERAGLVTRGRQAQWRPCALDPHGLDQVSTWAEQCRSVWQSRFEQMDDYLQRLQTSRKDPRT